MKLHNCVNYTREIDFGTRKAFEKTYEIFSRSTGVALPLERATIEARVHSILRILCDDLFDSIVVADVLAEKESPRRNIYEMHPSTALRSLACVEWPPEEVFVALGGLAARVELLRGDWTDTIFAHVEEAQRDLGITIRKYKGLSAMTASPSVLCLGDFGLSNLALTDRRLLVCDFEFAHRGYRGFDVGQLLAELIALQVTTGQVTASIGAAVAEGYRRDGGSIDAAFGWREEFSDYYLKRYREIRPEGGVHGK